ncbi:hypothetical protein Adt_28192 [Abeliophyllum distichum]|uniref:Uncharacterized protein n=1 Tax=Abeliophyllum distichum TaxID=126358 RepID=A0ABD1S029_9LAMI
MRLLLHPFLEGYCGPMALLQPRWPQMDGSRWSVDYTRGSDIHSDSWFWVAGNWQRVADDPELDLDVPNVYGIAKDLRQKKVLEDLSQEGNRDEAEAPNVAEIEDTNASEVDVPLTRKRKVETSGVGSSSQSKGKAIEVVDNYTICGVPPLQRTITVNPSGEVVLESPSQATQNPESSVGGPYDSWKKLRELIGAPGPRIPDDALQNMPFYPTIEAQAMKKYFTPRWEEFASHGDLDNVVEVGLAAAIRASRIQLKVLGVQAVVDSMRTAYEHFKADLRESESNVLNLTKQLDNANAAQKFVAEALEAANK